MMSTDSDDPADPPEPAADGDRPVKVVSLWLPLIVCLLTVLGSAGAAFVTAKFTLDNDREQRQHDTAREIHKEQSGAYASLAEAANELRGRLWIYDTKPSERSRLGKGSTELVRKAENADALLQTSPDQQLREQAHDVGWLTRYAADCLNATDGKVSLPGDDGKPLRQTCAEVAGALTVELDKLREVVPPAFNKS
ncbi:hypothetical protein [Streptomyces sp. NPDC053048]|uniref:hypothetical protein n=1 Tax=Streptomyces sp. NPDC053048 TaxID=3365694 RepID=UPI0037D33310